MKTEAIVVSSKGQGMDAALAQAEAVGAQLGLGGREAIHLRLLAEEMMNMMRSIIGALQGRFWIEADGGEYRLYLKTVTLMDSEQRAQLIGASTSGKNEAHRGIMGKIRAFFEPMPIDDTPAYLVEAIESDPNGDLTWSLEAYRERLRRNKDNGGEARDEWDELEKSLVTHLADDVKVSIRGNDVELTIFKAYRK